jgi:epoxyqueuosine reductase
LAITAEQVKQVAADCGFELAGITAAVPHADYSRFEQWRRRDFAGAMSYLTDHRGDLRSDPRNLLSKAKSIICVGKLYNTAHPHTDSSPGRGWISRYAWGSDYHEVVRQGLSALVGRIREIHGAPFESRICVDTAPLLERSYAREAGLGWIGKNTCLINQQQGSWFFLGELLLTIPLSPDTPPPDRCGTCRRCIDACPTAAIVPSADGEAWTLDSRLCISYLTIEWRGPRDQENLPETGNHIFGCDICQDVCPWNWRSGVTEDERFAPGTVPFNLDALSLLSAEEFRDLFRHSPVWRAKYDGFLRNVAVAMGNSQNTNLLEPLKRLGIHPNPTIALTAIRAVRKLRENF